VSTLAPVQGLPKPFSLALGALLAALCALLLATGADAAPAQRIAGPDLPARSAPSLQRSGSSAIGLGKLQRKLRDLAAQAPGSSGFYVVDLDAKGHRVLFDRKQGKRRKLASNEKLFTTSTALHTLGPDGRLETKVKAAGKLTRAGKLKGDLYLIGGGDPSLGDFGMKDLADDVRHAGIKRVSGTVVADDSIFDRLRGVPDSNYGPSPYVAPLSGLVYGGSTYDGDPAKEAGKAFRGALRSAGVSIGGKVKVDELPGKLKDSEEVGSHDSEPLRRIVAATNKPSNNFYAEMLLKDIAAAGNGKGTTRGGVKLVERYAKSVGSKVSARDGSGLTANNRSSPKDVVRLLDAVHDDRETGDALFDSLSIAGQDGTLENRMGGTVAAGRCRGKTGTITGVSNVSGYCKSGHGLVAFSILMNGVGDLNAAHSIQDRMVVQIARYEP
jgi:D-alanyl-D-alanine carboxypeptidase/D-alanyl-D-alanine-endopeptidase (penicillin-binding protein 4)